MSLDGIGFNFYLTGDLKVFYQYGVKQFACTEFVPLYVG